MFLNHPNIIKLYNFFVDSDNIYLLLEPCLGNDLYKKLKSAPEGLQEKEIAGILKQVCQAVEYMHQNDIIHRDIKAENVLFHENVVKICDFGWAIHSPLLRDTRCGTPLYASPEMLKK
jgi:aurora kinase